MATEYSDYTEQNILIRTEKIYTEFIKFFKKQKLLKGYLAIYESRKVKGTNIQEL